jgi:hypothetical protein
MQSPALRHHTIGSNAVIRLEQSDEVPVELAKLGETRTWDTGTKVATEGDEADCMFNVHLGELRAVPGPLPQARMAERLGALKAQVNRLLQDLARGGSVEVSRARTELPKELPP